MRVLVENSIPMGNTQFRALHGLSMLVQSTYEGSRTNVLWDVGADPDVLFNNMQEMEIDPGQTTASPSVTTIPTIRAASQK